MIKGICQRLLTQNTQIYKGIKTSAKASHFRGSLAENVM